MMRMTVTTFNVLKRLHAWAAFRPYNFFLLPMLAKGGCPVGRPKAFHSCCTFRVGPRKWLGLPRINIAAPKRSYRIQAPTSFILPEYGSARAVLQVLEDLLYGYQLHPEAKSLSVDGRPCDGATRGLLQRAHIIAGKHRRIGKESDPRWEEGSDLEEVTWSHVLSPNRVRTTRQQAQMK